FPVLNPSLWYQVLVLIVHNPRTDSVSILGMCLYFRGKRGGDLLLTTGAELHFRKMLCHLNLHDW
ncbi:hypothetical protein, partial [Fluoribacter gormanii]|uniref:hypothetical protein n=1 Tax=Fluoribacter gormanii TaxID=464 RepID=UPI001A93D802